MDSKINEVRDWAIDLHGKQKYGEHDYIYHLDLVYELAVSFGMSNDYLMAAYLHDVIEDCALTKEMVEKISNKNVANMVWAVSGFGESRKEKKQDMIQKMLAYPESINLKMLDRYINIEESKLNNPKLYKMYVQEMEDYKDVFQLGNSRIYAKLLELIDMSVEEVNTVKKARNKP